MRRLVVRAETWPLRGAFTISRGTKTEAHVVVAEISDGDAVGRGECVPYPRYGEAVADVVARIEALAAAVGDGLDRDGLRRTLPAGAARNALDCALWDLEAKRTGRPVWRLAGLAEPAPLETAFTIGLGPPTAMAAAARLTNPAARCVGIAVDTSRLARPEGERLLAETEDKLGIPCADPLATGVGRIVDSLE